MTPVWSNASVSCVPVTVTGRAVDQFIVVKVNAAGAKLNPSPLDIEGVTVTLAVGWESRTTVYVSVVPSSISSDASEDRAPQSRRRR